MKFTIKRNAFIKKLTDVQRAISSKTAIEILTGLKITATENSITLTGSDSDISIENEISTDDSNYELLIDEPGSIVLPARFFSEIIKRLPESTFTVEVNDHFQATITSGQTEYQVNGVDADNYPHLPEIDTNEQLTIPADIMKQVINQTVIAVSTQESRPLLTGVHLTIKDGELHAVATDSHRLSQRKVKLSGAEDIDYDIIVPGRSLVELSRMIADSTGSLEIQIAENQILFNFDNTAFYSRLLEGMYPDTDRLIPQSSETEIELNAVSLLHAIERASLLSHEGRNNVVKLSLNSENQTAVLSSNSPEVGNIEEELQFDKLTGNDIEISFNPDYMKAALQAFGQAEVKLSLTLPLRPFTLMPTEDSEDFIQLITPVRTY
ncbi:DNA polymerase III subunit beta [Ligilactobacillus aviarius]|uniref:DNA polymerase III subunit beta n=1 Tax=Ligilactobacillus aviarius TaxID=1606 RepID=UPI0007D97106|nr:DNA polymerase III subunit beta [Ligilactobacillus aviarius]OAQ03748.1 DNA polymerase III subunit beta [Ligilactobacillus aviarius]OAQ05593.1 DNA polymerase III subunit beta [Ligilactobacillus aviarius]OAS79338.1 DNA polymerase III subunit beta [Ligilactobacillus aviarius]PEG71177.1 DNA polymerase III subunit beta [Ligilactobacillus aviarius]PEG74449.1 DNA polymerase III subunit beta [Ligilactobacillus aviarius]